MHQGSCRAVCRFFWRQLQVRRELGECLLLHAIGACLCLLCSLARSQCLLPYAIGACLCLPYLCSLARSQCQLWVKPQLLFNWLTLAKSRGYNCARLLCHGNSKGEYDKFAQDPQVFRLDISQSGAQGNGIYLAAYTAIAKYYNCKDVCGLRKTHYPDGTMILTLLLTQDGAGYGAYSRYRVSGNIPVTQTQSHDDAYSVRDQALILPLGLAVASKSKKRR